MFRARRPCEDDSPLVQCFIIRRIVLHLGVIRVYLSDLYLASVHLYMLSRDMESTFAFRSLFA